MIAFGRLPLVLALTILAVGSLGVLFGSAPPAFGDLYQILWLVVVVEMVVYFAAAVLSETELGGFRSFVLAFGLAVVRFVVCLAAGLILAMNQDLGMTQAVLRAWVGNPVGVFLQGIVLMLATPHVLQSLAPGLISDSMEQILTGRGEAETGRASAHESAVGEVTPVGGFIQVFSLQELQSMFRKSIGMEGFIIYTSEGLVLWKDMPIRLEVDALVARAQAVTERLAGEVEDAGLASVTNILVESRDHLIFNTRLSPDFGLIMIFANGVKVQECWARLAVMARSTQEYLHWKYPTLDPLGSAVRIPLREGAQSI
jgi:predicted regulator of Ras-like GTPase activity (Roadblock/LC7/MglB family)